MTRYWQYTARIFIDHSSNTVRQLHGNNYYNFRCWDHPPILAARRVAITTPLLRRTPARRDAVNTGCTYRGTAIIDDHTRSWHASTITRRWLRRFRHSFAREIHFSMNKRRERRRDLDQFRHERYATRHDWGSSWN